MLGTKNRVMNMKETKIFSMLMVILFLGAAFVPLSGAVDLEANINVEIEGWIGNVSPSINNSTDEQQIELKVKVNESRDFHPINDTIAIDLNIFDNSERQLGIFILPRLVLYRFALKADPDDILEKPTFKTTGMVNVVRSLFGKPSEKIELALNYQIDNETLDGDPVELYLIMHTMGLLPGNINGQGLLGNGNPIVDRGVVKLTIDYVAE